MRMHVQGPYMSAGPVVTSRFTLKVVVFALLVIILAGLTAWNLNQLMGQTAAKRAPEPLWTSTPPDLTIPESVLAQLAPPPPPTDFAPGETVGRIVIPRASVDSPIVEMANCQDNENLNKGPAHIKGTGLPGADGNCAIAGHRSTYTQPFSEVGSLQVGDEIILINASRVRYAYRVTRIWVVSPDQVSVLDPTPEPSVTLITCHPPGSARSRLIIRAVRSG